MSSLNNARDIPAGGTNLIIVGAVDHVIHFRIFDYDGNVVVDTDENGLTQQSRSIEDLRKQLESLWPPHEPTRSEKDQVILDVTSIVGYKSQHLTLSQYNDLSKESCHYCGTLPANLTKYRIKENVLYNGLDRVDNNKPYSLDNTVPCCKICNSMKSNLTESEFLSHIRRIFEFQQSLQKTAVQEQQC